MLLPESKNDAGHSYPGHSTRARYQKKIFKQYGPNKPIKVPHLTQEEVLALKQAWALDCPSGAVHKL